MQFGRGDGGDEARASTGEVTLTAASEAIEPEAAPARDRNPAPLQYRDPDRYEIVAEHGRGGLGRVFRAHDKELGRDVAVKELLERTHRSEVRFFREALITARLEHPGIVPVHEAGRWPDGTPFYAMKLVAGEPMRALLDRCATANDRRALIPNLLSVADAIAYAHDRRIVHRDLKPSNIIVGRFGETVVIDWGLAKDLTATGDDGPADGPYRAAASSELTRTGAVLGTPAYMSPEQARGEDVDERTDVFALGAILRELDVGPDADLDAIITKATAPDRRRRYATAAALAADLRAYVGGRRISARRYSVSAAIRHWIRGHRAITAVLAAAIAVVAVVGVLAVTRVVRARDRAEAALGIASAERAKAVLAHAQVLLERDPTAGLALLVEDGLDEKDPLLAARLRAAGVAERSFSIGQRFPNVTPFAGTSRYAAVSTDRALHVIDAATGAAKAVDHGLTLPVELVGHGADVVYLVRRDGGHGLAVADADGAIRDVARLQALPEEIASDGAAVYVLDASGALSRVDVATGAATPLDDDVETIVGVTGSALGCRRDGTIMRYDVSGARPVPGPCTGDRTPMAAGAFAVFPSPDDHIVIVGDSGARRVAFRTTNLAPQFVVAASGLVLGVDPDGNGLFIPPGGEAATTVRFRGGRVAMFDGAGTLAVWGFDDGSIVARDVATDRVWTIQGHDGALSYVFVEDPAGTLVTIANVQIRRWRLDPRAAATASVAPDLVFTAVHGRDGVLLDSRSGQAALLRGADLVPLHRHSALAYGAAWCGELACTGSWDGTVRCSDPATRELVATRTTGSTVRSLVAAGGDCLYAAADGTVGLVLGGGVLHRTDEEPRRLLAGRDGQAAVVADAGGTLTVLDDSGQRPVAQVRHAHRGPVTEVARLGDAIVSAGWDGMVKVWSAELALASSYHADGPVLHLATGAGRIVLVTERGALTILDADGVDRGGVELRTLPAAIALSPDGARVAAATQTGELLLIDTATLAISARRLDRTGLSCVTFLAEHEILACSLAGTLLRVDVQEIDQGG